MSRPDFDQLHERLLRAGIAPRHVRRYVGELTAHFDDLVREEMDKGVARASAEADARARVGDDDALADAMLSQPGVRSVSARYPWAVFGLGPAALLFAVLVGAVLIEFGLLKLLVGLGEGDRFSGADVPGWLKDFIWAWNRLVMYAAPLAIAAMILFVGRRQRISIWWIALGVVVACVAGGFHQMSAHWSDEPGMSSLGAGFAFAPPFPGWLLISGTWRAAINLALMAAVWWFWLRQRFPATVR